MNGDIEPLTGADRIWQDFAKPLDYPPALMPFVSAIIDAYSPEPAPRTPDQINADIHHAAHELLTQAD